MGDFILKDGVLSRYNGPGGAVTVPEEVREVGKDAFLNCAGVTRIVIPKSVNKIERYAFCCYYYLITWLSWTPPVVSGVSLPDGLRRIGAGAFQQCWNLQEVELPQEKIELEKESLAGFSWDRPSAPALLAPNLSLKEIPTDLRVRAVVGFALLCARNRPVKDAVREEYLKYIRGQRKRLYAAALQTPELLYLMLREKMVPLDDLERLLEEAAGSGEMAAALLDYQEKQFPAKFREKKRTRDLEVQMDILMTNVLPASEAKKLWQYEQTEAGVRLLGYKGTEEDILIPAAIGKDPVTAIGPYALSPAAKPLTGERRAFRRDQLRSAVIPAGVTEIGAGAFYGCCQLTGVDIPDSVTAIGDGAFSHCIRLSGVAIPAGVTEIGSGAFLDCIKLTGVTIPEGVTEIGESTFAHTGLTEIKLPAGVTKVGDGAFCSCARLTEAVLPDGVTEIGERAFACTGLIEIKLPAGVTKVRDSAFRDCGSLTEAVLPEALTEIEARAFQACRLKRIVLPEGFRRIGYFAFAYCKKLEEAVLPASVEAIDPKAFNKCAKLTIRAPEGSYAQRFAGENGIPFRPL